MRRALFALALLWPACAQAQDTSTGQTVYVPVYSHVLHGNRDGRGKPQEWLLSAMLSIRNTDPAQSMTVTRAGYYDTHGRLIRETIGQALVLPPMGSAEIFVENRDASGGSGANFLVEWTSASPINAPILETVHSYFFGTHSTAFTSRGVAITTAK